jgi:hypothetical protein
MVYVIQVCWQLAMRIRMVPPCSCSQAVSKPVWHMPSLCVQWKTPDDGQRNCPKHVEFHSENKFEKLVHLVGFIIREILYFCSISCLVLLFPSLTHQLIRLFQTCLKSIFLAISTAYTFIVRFTGYRLNIHGRLWFIILFFLCCYLQKKIDLEFWVCGSYVCLRMSQCPKTLLDVQSLVLLYNKWRNLFPLSHTFMRITGSLCENNWEANSWREAVAVAQ